MRKSRLRIATNGRRRNSDTGQWEDAPNYFDVTVWGQQGENCQRFLSKGRQIAIDGRLRFREWTGQQGEKRNGVDIIAESVQFLGGRDEGAGSNGGGGNGFSSRTAESDVPIDSSECPLRAAGASAVGSACQASSPVPW